MFVTQPTDCIDTLHNVFLNNGPLQSEAEEFRVRHRQYDVAGARTFGAEKCMGRKIAAIFCPTSFCP